MNPYTPGFDAIPPVLAGREYELQQLMDASDRLLTNAVPPVDMIVYGPRGNGKTALLNQVYKLLKESAQVRPIVVVPPDIASPTELHQTLVGQAIPVETTEVVKAKGGVGVSRTGVEAGQETSRAYKTLPTDLKERSLQKLAATPTLLMVDEAHRITGETLDEILSLARIAKREEARFSFILAGTPGLMAHLQTLNSTFLNRAHRIRIERLDPSSARAALLQPLERADYELRLTADEANNLVDQTQGYPHFIQCVGYALWNEGEVSGQKAIDTQVVAAAAIEWEKRVLMMYSDRMRELESRELTGFAVVLAEVFSDSSPKTLHIEEIKRNIKKVDESADVQTVISILEELGYIWESRDEGLLFEPGIPSLMDYVLQNDRRRLHHN